MLESKITGYPLHANRGIPYIEFFDMNACFSMKLVNKDDNESHIRKMIAEAAYFRAQKRNFQGGDSTRDWLEAEKEIRLIR